MVSALRLEVSDSRLEFQSLRGFVSSFPFLYLFVYGLLFVIPTQLLFAKPRITTKVPHYKIDISYDHDKTLLVGKMQVRFARNAYPAQELLFALPGNRFSFPDVRGTRKHKIVPVFSLRRFHDNLEDPKSPTGFSPGSLEINSVRTFSHEPTAENSKLKFSLEPNPDLAIGYSTARGLLPYIFA